MVTHVTPLTKKLRNVGRAMVAVYIVGARQIVVQDLQNMAEQLRLSGKTETGVGDSGSFVGILLAGKGLACYILLSRQTRSTAMAKRERKNKRKSLCAFERGVNVSSNTQTDHTRRSGHHNLLI